MNNMKRILKVTVIREQDCYPDTSYIGEYSNKADSKYAIDRRHAEDCLSLLENHTESIDKLERVIFHLDNLRRSPEVSENPDNTEWESLDEAISICTGLQEFAQECDCRDDLSSREYRYFNPPYQNYKGCTPAEIRKYCRQDYERAESLNRGDWCYLGIWATAEYVLTSYGKWSADKNMFTGGCGPIQELSSGGLYGIESDSEQSYLESIEKDELFDLRTQLKAIGFSARAISNAFKNTEHKDT